MCEALAKVVQEARTADAAGTTLATSAEPLTEANGPSEAAEPANAIQRCTIQDFQCSVCRELLNEPEGLTCGHAVCSSCLPGPGQPLGSCNMCSMPHVCRPRPCKLVRTALCVLTSLVLELYVASLY